MSIFTDDVFISYAHQNNEDGWVEAFHAELLIQLNDLLPRKPIIWRDARLTGGDVFSDEIQDKLKTTKLLVSILSPRYITSGWCGKELAVFRTAAEQSAFGLKIKNKSRIIKAVKIDVPREEHPSEFADTTGFEFFERDQQTKEDNLYNHEKNGQGYQLFKTCVKRVALHIKEIVTEIDKQSLPPTLQVSNKPVVFLAETVSGLKDDRKKIRNELEARGYQVLPPDNANLSCELMSDYKKAVEPYLKDARLSVHLIGKSYGSSLEDTPKSIVALQNEWAAERRNKDTFESLIWIKEDVDVQEMEDLRQKDFLNYLLNDSAAQQYAEPSHNNFEKFKEKLVIKLQKIEEQPPPPGPINIKKGFVCIHCISDF